MRRAIRRDGAQQAQEAHRRPCSLIRASPCLFQLGEHSGQQFVLRPQEELDRAEALAIRCPLGVFLEGGVWRKGADGGHGCSLDLVAVDLTSFCTCPLRVISGH